MAPGLTTDSGAIQNGKPQPPLPIRRAKGSQAQLIGVGNSSVLLSQISNVPLLGVVHDLNRVLRLGGDDNIVVRMTCTLLQRRTIEIWLVKRYVGIKRKAEMNHLPLTAIFLSQIGYSESNYQGTSSSRIWSMTDPPIHMNTSGTLSIEWYATKRLIKLNVEHSPLPSRDWLASGSRKILLDLRRGKRVISDRIYHRYR
ncbi:hypothetical protein PIB30_046322 [Stylosanthes scabra]|uniref:Uncharacterized protein n=1 Tax=Stylosanthes scabra TaxID=79078 RepID=A0ABU6TH44_9FABA|nr:hypothetical protein [Stylosanthes scabra]